MSDWQWFEDYEKEALAQGDHERARLRQIHREAYSLCETDPDEALSLLAEGRRLALTLQEPWWVLLFDHWQVHITLYEKSDYRNVLEPAVRNVLEVRKPQYARFPQKLWVVGDLIEIYMTLDPHGYAEEIEQALAELEAELTPQMDSARYLFMFHQLDAAANQGRADDALQIALEIRAKAQADPVRSTGDHYLISCYRALCHFYKLRYEWPEVATWAEAGETLARQLGQKQPVGVFLMWQAVVAQQRGERDKAARLFRSAISRMGRLKSPPERDYYEAMCCYQELRGEPEKSVQVRTQEIQDFMARGKVYDEFDARLAQLRLLAQIGQTMGQQLSDARQAAGKFRRPECYLPQIEQIASKAAEPVTAQQPTRDEEGSGGPRPIDQTERGDVLATIREVFSSGGRRDRDQAIRDVAAALGYQRVGNRIHEVLDRDIQTAVRRGILENTGGQLLLLCRSINEYTLDHLIDMLRAAMGGVWWKRDQAIVAAARHLGFRRTGKNIEAAFQSAIRAAIRRGLLERRGADEIRKAR